MRQVAIRVAVLLASTLVFAAGQHWSPARSGGSTARAGAAAAADGAATAQDDRAAALMKERMIAWGPVAVFGLAVVDSAGIPLLSGVELALAVVSTAGAARGYAAALLAVIGSIVGSLILFSIARKGGEAYLKRKCVTPRARRLCDWFQRYGLLTVFIPALLPVVPLPEKIFVVSAGALGVSTRAFALTIAAARIPRYFAIAYLGVKAGENSLVWFEENAVALTVFAAVLFAALYAAVNITGRIRARAAAR